MPVVLMAGPRRISEGRKRVAIAIYKPPREGFQVKGTFMKMHNSGELFDEFSSKMNPMLAGIGPNCKVQSVATIKVTEVYALTIPIAEQKNGLILFFTPYGE